MNIVYLNPIGEIGGAEVALLHLLGVLRETRPQWNLFLVAGTEGPLLSRAEALGVASRVIPLPVSIRRLGDAGLAAKHGPSVGRPAFFANLISGGMDATTYLTRLRRAIYEAKPDLVHSNGFKMHLLSTYASDHHTPIVWHIHDYVSSRRVTRPLLRLRSSRCSTAVANSVSVAADLRSIGNLNVEPIYNGIDTDVFAPNGPFLDLDSLAGLPPSAPDVVRVGLLGTFARWKGHEVFLRALSLFDPALPIRGYIIGGPIYQTNGSQRTIAELKNLASDLGLSGKVGFTGLVGNPAEAIRALDVVVHASTQAEPFGLVIVEAMACGKPVIVSNCGGASELVQDRVNALTHKPGDAVAMAALIRELAEDPRLRARLGEAARRTAEERFSRARFGEEFVQVYTRLISTQRLRQTHPQNF
jgi:glycosyltransferase involved in cell wall biosynthesis